MKVLKSNINHFIKNIKNEQVKGIFLYGQDVGVLINRENEIFYHFPEFEKIKLDLTLEHTMEDVLQESLTSSLFGAKKFIQIKATEGKLGEIGLLLQQIKEDFPNFLLISVYESLDAKSKARKLFENSPNIACIACYADEEIDISNIINTFLRQNSLTANQDVIKYLIEKFKSNRSILLLELEKVKLYKGSGNITLIEAQTIMDENPDGSIFEAINLFFSIKIKSLLEELSKIKEDVIPPAVLITNLINYNFKLLEILEEQELTKKPLDVILNERQVFFKQIPQMKDHLSKWDLERLNSLVKPLLEAEVVLRENSTNGYDCLGVFLPSFLAKL